VALRTIGRALPALALPPLILATILTGIATPTEAAVVAAAYAYVLGALVYREIGLRRTCSIRCGRAGGRRRRSWSSSRCRRRSAGC
jgi:TRAP-type C4-dicarboxylate transport system permease large subunit